MRMRLVGADFAYAAVETQNPRYYGVKEATREIVTAIAAIVAHATEWNVDTHRLILVGNGSAAYFAVLLATHPGYLIECGIDPSDVKGIVLITPDGLFGPDAVIADSRLSAAEAKGYFGDAGDTGDISPDPDRRSSVVKSYLIFDHPRGHPRDVARFVRAVSHDGVVVNVQPIVATINGISATYLGSRSSTAGDGFVAFARQVTAIPLP